MCKLLTTVRITDLDKLNLVKLSYGGSILGSSQLLLLPQNEAHFKSGQKWLKNNHLALLG